jgi:multiple sugar transport system substrate-binding protein
MIVDPPCRGLSWDHPRGYAALTAAAECANVGRGAPLLAWDRQPLEGFESRPIGELARDYDLLVIDHPHIGEAVAEGCLVPLEDVFDASLIAGWAARTIGSAMASYALGGQHWVLPLDVATQVMASRPDLLPRSQPGTWDDVVRMSERCPVAVSVAGPHALLHLFALCAALGNEPGGEDLLASAPFGEAWRILAALHAHAPGGTTSLNPIELLEAMAGGNPIALVPLVYGYVNYAVPARGRHALAFDEAPVAVQHGRRGSVLGGTGIAITRRACLSPELRAHLVWLLSEEAQTQFIPLHEGQPSARTAWLDDAVNARWAGFYRRTAITVAGALVRPRHAGYIAFQTRASAMIRAALHDGTDATTILHQLRATWRSSLVTIGRKGAFTGARTEP